MKITCVNALGLAADHRWHVPLVARSVALEGPEDEDGDDSPSPMGDPLPVVGLVIGRRNLGKRCPGRRWGHGATWAAGAAGSSARWATRSTSTA